jgi:hypothetical protein
MIEVPLTHYIEAEWGPEPVWTLGRREQDGVGYTVITAAFLRDIKFTLKWK